MEKTYLSAAKAIRYLTCLARPRGYMAMLLTFS
jgi:hypothetical protein